MWLGQLICRWFHRGRYPADAGPAVEYQTTLPESVGAAPAVKRPRANVNGKQPPRPRGRPRKPA